ncbi:MAG TPA: hypothetical protein VEG32_06230 [Clostridia bacterium]|nr:hypothetical protein [Clostridia bacterium]
MAVEMPQVEGHPNRCGFRGVLTTVDRASDRAPSGARGHRVMLTAEAAEAALPSLLGMAVDYAPELDRHDARRKAGIITDAELRNLATGGQCIAVRGYIFARDFPEVIEAVREMGRAELGMSYEIADVRVADVNAEVWRVTQFAFTGAAVLKRGRAAYRDTWLELEN